MAVITNSPLSFTFGPPKMIGDGTSEMVGLEDVYGAVVWTSAPPVDKELRKALGGPRRIVDVIIQCDPPAASTRRVTKFT